MSKPKKTKKINLPFRVSALNVAVEDGADGLAQAFCTAFAESPPSVVKIQFGGVYFDCYVQAVRSQGMPGASELTVKLVTAGGPENAAL